MLRTVAKLSVLISPLHMSIMPLLFTLSLSVSVSVSVSLSLSLSLCFSHTVCIQGPSATIKTHHNVGGLPASMHLKLLEPLRELFKDEVLFLF